MTQDAIKYDVWDYCVLYTENNVRFLLFVVDSILICLAQMLKGSIILPNSTQTTTLNATYTITSGSQNLVYNLIFQPGTCSYFC